MLGMKRKSLIVLIPFLFVVFFVGWALCVMGDSRKRKKSGCLCGHLG